MSEAVCAPSSAMEARCTLPAIVSSCLRLCLRFPAGLNAECQPAFLLHGALGAVLHEVEPICYELLFGSQSLVKPWLMRMPSQAVAPGGQTWVEFRLFNEACPWAARLAAALSLVGLKGLGAERQPFILTAVQLPRPGGLPPLDWSQVGAQGAVFPVTAWCDSQVVGRRLRCRFISPLRLKNGNDLVRQAPDFATLLARIHTRAALLAGTSAAWAHSKADLMQAARAVQITDSRVTSQKCHRYSARQGQAMSFEGLVGEVCYGLNPDTPGTLARFAPWLDLAALLHVGGKTTFGFGALAWQALS